MLISASRDDDDVTAQLPTLHRLDGELSVDGEVGGVTEALELVAGYGAVDGIVINDENIDGRVIADLGVGFAEERSFGRTGDHDLEHGFEEGAGFDRLEEAGGKLILG